ILMTADGPALVGALYLQGGRGQGCAVYGKLPLRLTGGEHLVLIQRPAVLIPVRLQVHLQFIIELSHTLYVNTVVLGGGCFRQNPALGTLDKIALDRHGPVRVTWTERAVIREVVFGIEGKLAMAVQGRTLIDTQAIQLMF